MVRHLLQKIGLCGVLVLGAVGFLLAGANRLTVGGPSGGDVVAVAISPQNSNFVWAMTTNRGPFRSINGGNSWASAGGSWYWQLEAQGLLIEPNSTDKVWVWGHYLGLRKTLDAGVNWMQVLPAGVESVAIDATDPKTLYAVTADGVIKTTNGGTSWSPVGEVKTKTSDVFTGRYVVADPVVHNAVYVTGTGVYRSTDGGDSWTRLDGTDIITQISGDRLDVAPTVPRSLVAIDIYKILHFSTDDGATWTRRQPPYGNVEVGLLTFDPAHPGTVYIGSWSPQVWVNPYLGGFWKSVNNGVVWDRLAPKACSALAIHPTTGELYLGSNPEGILRSTDGGVVWTATNSGMNATEVACLTAIPDGIGAAVAGVWGMGAVRSADGGATWEVLGGGPADLRLTGLSATALGVVYAGTLESGVFRRNAGSASWAAVNNGLTYQNITTVAVDPLNSDTLWTGASRWDFFYYVGGAFRSPDAGANWVSVGLGPTLHLLADPNTANAVYACTRDGFRTSANGGTSWQTTGLNFSSTAADPLRPGTLYGIIPEGGVWKTVDGGQTWWDLREIGPEGYVYRDLVLKALEIAVDPLRSEVVYLRTASFGTWVSPDGGVSWTGLGVDMPMPLDVPMYLKDTLCLATRPVWPGGVVVGTPFDGAISLTVDPFDLNFDGVRNAADRQGLYSAMAGTVYRVPGPLACGDMNGDRKVNAIDVVLMARSTN